VAGPTSRVDLGRLLAGDHRDAVLDGRGHEFLTIRAAAGLRGDGRWEPDGLPKRSWADCLVIPSAWPTTAQDRPGRAQVGRGGVLELAGGGQGDDQPLRRVDGDPAGRNRPP
jgi:hypothetical protein